MESGRIQMWLNYVEFISPWICIAFYNLGKIQSHPLPHWFVSPPMILRHQYYWPHETNEKSDSEKLNKLFQATWTAGALGPEAGLLNSKLDPLSLPHKCWCSSLIVTQAAPGNQSLMSSNSITLVFLKVPALLCLVGSSQRVLWTSNNLLSKFLSVTLTIWRENKSIHRGI